MPNFAVIDGNNVINTITAESKQIAEEVTGKPCIEYQSTDKAELGGTYNGTKFFPKQPFPSYTLDEENAIWLAPVEYPKDGNFYIWNEDKLNWDLTPNPYKN